MTTHSKSTISPELILAARRGLAPVGSNTVLGGFGNMLRKELGQWWSTPMGWVQTLIWVLLLNGVTTIIALTETTAPAERVQEVILTFFPLSVGAISMATVITAQGAIVGEKQLGTAAWVMSKPASRSAFILAKVIAYALGFCVTAMLIPTTIFAFGTLRLIPASFSMAPLLGGVAVVALSQLFYLALTIMLGTFFNSRGPITGIGIGMVMSGLLLRSLIPPQVQLLSPWPLPNLSGAIALGMPLPSGWSIPIVVTSAGIVIMVALALWRFGREEF